MLNDNYGRRASTPRDPRSSVGLTWPNSIPLWAAVPPEIISLSNHDRPVSRPVGWDRLPSDCRPGIDPARHSADLTPVLRSGYTMRTKCAISDAFVRDCVFA